VFIKNARCVLKVCICIYMYQVPVPKVPSKVIFQLFFFIFVVVVVVVFFFFFFYFIYLSKLNGVMLHCSYHTPARSYPSKNVASLR
jgi:hypothetical protein